ncbi:hypothetical protein BCR32DRAFT_292870 [Anaeromyces robustus]|jgi:hypothetical protein|uniref:protein disulfide-isomerase n=1 Tax=Anaeromyces robustus TaxID=1754192 RepID=A0A1Y1X8P5_9FUNG|nr:hypothetical protein BCR32DRAFT_292870 [Anaeromyces robustus]|eukprot:ORX82108.1 hypothetical protein BCR32DRAFT_292870 [Anaeromyces robustus]
MNKLYYILILTFFFILQITASVEENKENNVVTVKEKITVTEFDSETQAVEEPAETVSDNFVKYFNAEELKNFVDTNEIAIVAFFDNLDAKEAPFIEGVARSLKEHERLNYIITTDPNSNQWATEKLNIQINNPGLIIFKQGNGYPIPFDKVQSTAMYDLRELCLKALKPYVDELALIENYNFDNLLYFYIDEEDKKNKFDLLQQLAIKYFQELNVKYINLDQNSLNINMPELRGKFIIVTKNVQSFYRQFDILSDEDETNFENISYFVDAYKAAIMDPQFLWRREEMNWEFNEYVTEIRPNIYDSVVLNENNDVIVLYYKADCPYSQQVMKSFQDLAKRYIDQRHKLTVGEFEAENQNIPPSSPWRNLQEYPTIVLYPASKNGKKRQYYVMKQNLGRSAINIANWLLKRVTNSYEEVRYSTKDFEKVTEIDGAIIQQDAQEEMEEIRVNKLLGDPDLIYTVFGEGKDQSYYSIESEAPNYYIGNTEYAELPLTDAYYELTPTTYVVHYAQVTNSAKEIAKQNYLNKHQNQE